MPTGDQRVVLLKIISKKLRFGRELWVLNFLVFMVLPYPLKLPRVYVL